MLTRPGTTHRPETAPHPESEAEPTQPRRPSSSPVAVLPAERGDEPLPRRGLVFFIVSMALFMASVDQTVVATALYSIQDDLGAGLEWTGWTVTIYSLGQVLVMPLAGKFSDLYGRKKVFLIGAVLFTLASLCCGLASNIYLLVVLRAVQAIGGGAFLPSATGIVADHFGRDRDRALGMFTSIFPIGGIVGPILGGVFVSYWSWRGIFLVNVPIGIVLIILCLVFIPESGRRPSKKIDAYGVVLLGALILSVMLGITYLGGSGSSPFDPGFWLPEAVAVVVLVLFLRHASRGSAPFIPMSLLRGGGFGVMNSINFLQGCTALGFGALVPLYALDRYGIPILQAGTLLSARAIGMICIAGMAVLALRRTGYRAPMIVGFAVTAGGLAWIALPAQISSPYLWVAIGAAISGLGMGLAMPASNNAILQLAPTEAASIAGMRGMFRQSGSIVSVSIATAVIARSDHPGVTLGHVFLIFAGILVLVLPLVLKVPEHRGSW